MASSGSRRTQRVRAGVLRAGTALVLVPMLLVAGALPVGASPSMQSTGSSFASVAIQQWVGQSSTLFGLNLNWQVSSSVIGLNNFGQNQIDFAASDIPYSAQQSTYYPTQPYQYLPDVAGGLAFMYNLNGNNGQRITNLNLNPSLIGQIFLGEITKWNNPAIAAANPAVAPNLPATNIIPVYRSDASGENYLLSDYLLHQDGPDFVAAQNAFQSGLPGQPTASWPVPASSARYDVNRYKGWNSGYPVGESGSDNAANYVSALSSQGSMTYVETAFAKEHGFPVANVQNASGGYVQPTSLNVATALEAALLHADLTQDLSKVYVNPLPNAYPLSAYSYIVAPCSPGLAAAQRSACAANPPGVPGSHPTGPTSPFPPQKGQALGQFAAFLACAGQAKMATLGYSPLPPVLVQEDFNAIGRMNGGQQPPPPTAANCKNPYVDGEIPLPGSPVVAGVSGGGVSAAGSTTTTGATTAGSGGGAGGSSGSPAGGSAGGASGSAVGTDAAALGLTPELAAQGYTIVNGQIVKRLDPAKQYQRANQLVAATDAIADPVAGMYLGWALVVLGAILLPPLIALRVGRRRAAAAAADGAVAGAGPSGPGAGPLPADGA